MSPWWLIYATTIELLNWMTTRQCLIRGNKWSRTWWMAGSSRMLTCNYSSTTDQWLNISWQLTHASQPWKDTPICRFKSRREGECEAPANVQVLSSQQIRSAAREEGIVITASKGSRAMFFNHKGSIAGNDLYTWPRRTNCVIKDHIPDKR